MNRRSQTNLDEPTELYLSSREYSDKHNLNLTTDQVAAITRGLKNKFSGRFYRYEQIDAGYSGDNPYMCTRFRVSDPEVGDMIHKMTSYLKDGNKLPDKRPRGENLWWAPNEWKGLQDYQHPPKKRKINTNPENVRKNRKLKLELDNLQRIKQVKKLVLVKQEEEQLQKHKESLK